MPIVNSKMVSSACYRYQKRKSTKLRSSSLGREKCLIMGIQVNTTHCTLLQAGLADSAQMFFPGEVSKSRLTNTSRFTIPDSVVEQVSS